MANLLTPISYPVTVHLLDFESSGSGPLGKGVALLQCLDDDGLVELEQSGTRQLGRITDDTAATAVWNEWSRGVATLVRIQSVDDLDQRVHGTFHAFSGSLLELTRRHERPWEIEVPEEALKAETERTTRGSLVDDVSLKSFGLGRGAEEFCLVLAPAGMEMVDSTPESAAFSVVGLSRRVDVYQIGPPAARRLVVRRVAKSKGRPQIDTALRLARLSIRFVEQSSALRSAIQSRLEVLENDPGAYLKKWDRYEERHLEVALARSIKIGRFAVQARTVDGNGETWDVSPSIYKELKVDERLEPWTADWDVEMYASGDTDTEHSPKTRRDSASDVTVVAKLKGGSRIVVRRIQGTEVTNATDWVLSVAGERKQHERRKQARLRIQQGRSENPSLGLIIEGEIPPVRRAGVKEVVAISPLVERKLFTYRSPVAAQVRAVSIALNTPDIAIIQGPPGTGKTTVINAIYERLGEIASERGGRSLPTLLTGPQHDAVLNMIERMDARGLPIEKLGQKGLKGGADQDEAQVQQFERWLGNYTEKVTRQFPRFQEHHWVTRVREALDDYRRSPTDAKALRLLDEIWAAPPALLSASWRMQAREASDALSRVGEPQVDELRSRAISILQSLRITHAGFADDGADGIERLLSTPEMLVQLLPEEVSQLRELSHSAPDDTSLRWIRALRQKLAEVFVPTFSGPSNSPRASVILLAEKVLASAVSVTRTEGPEAALARFVQQIGVDPLLLRNAAREYATAVAATVQQSQGNGVSSSVFGGADAILPRFDAVIVDEAARATPGDLMIPMTFARQRIILVGDHRQLPHMIDEQIIKQLEDEGSTEGFRDALERSLFQHLKERAEALTLSDGIQRVVTLDAQFRMHPTLGQFVSENFYLPYGESFASPRPGSDFEHTLKPFAGSCAGWVDVGRSIGAEEKVPGGTSFFRVAEVDAVEGLLRQWTEDQFSRNLSVGVIAFYSEQRDRLKERISSESLDPSGRVTVGTVDSFQGREFDAVILSAVRTSPAPGSKAEYGHLVSANRLCVAMSRQKRLLVVVGDGKHFSGEFARKKVPALRSFYRLCDEQSAVIGWK